MSVLGKKWIIRNSNPELSTFEKILKNRDFKGLDMDTEVFHDPFLFTDMDKAVSRIKKAIKEKERIIIFGDYDVDGITGTAILVHTLKNLGANVSYRIPHRVDDGYGLSMKYIDEFVEKDVKLIITVDCGISCFNEVQKGNENGIDTIITDHHTIPEKVPEAHAIIHPKYDEKYPYDDLTGSGVAFKLAHALIQQHYSAEEHEKMLDPLTDLASLGTVADMGPLRGENRLIVKKGLRVLSNTSWSGLKKIMKLASVGKNQAVDTVSIGYHIAPRINAAGRIGNPYVALSLLLQEEEGATVEALGKQLEELNTKRQLMTYEALNQVQGYFSKEHPPDIFIVENKNWHVGILGLVAGRLAEKYRKPAIIMQDCGDTLVASARSPKYFNIIEAITHCSKHLISFGGHAQAAGFNLKKENLEAFRKEITKYTKKIVKNIDTTPILNVDCEIADTEVNFDLLEELEQLKPFGIACEKPTFLLNNVEPQFINLVGKEKNHLKFSVQTEKREVQVIGFNMGEHVDKIRKYRKVDIVCSLERNRWNNKEYLQLRALDFRPSKV